MTLVSTLARLEAAATGRAQPLTTVRHRHLAGRPLVLVPLAAAGEAGAPLGAMVGTDPEQPVLLTVPQPRDRGLRFGFLAELAAVVLPCLESAQDETEQVTSGRGAAREEVELCTDAPQLLVPNTDCVEFVRLLGRSTRFRRTVEEDPEAAHPVPARVPLLGRWLTHYGERSRVPGSSLLLAMTELLSRHWATGQSRLEERHLGALLAWLRASEGNGAEAALRAETARDRDGLLLTPPAGPATDPAFDNRRLAPAVERFDAGIQGAEEEIRTLVAGQLRPTWTAMWEGVELLRSLPPGERVAARWEGDRWSYTAHRDRLRAGEPPQPRRDDAVTAARKLAARERDQARLAAQEALDDPLVMAERRLAGEAFTGEVTGVEPGFTDKGRPRPLVTLRTDDRPHLEEGTEVYRAPAGARTPQKAEFVASPGPGLITVRLTSGMGSGKAAKPGTVPEEGDRLCWTLFEHAPRGRSGFPEPEDTPWTHGGPPGPDRAPGAVPDFSPVPKDGASFGGSGE